VHWTWEEITYLHDGESIVNVGEIGQDSGCDGVFRDRDTVSFLFSYTRAVPSCALFQSYKVRSGHFLVLTSTTSSMLLARATGKPASRAFGYLQESSAWLMA
jgi:hypothetical protein